MLKNRKKNKVSIFKIKLNKMNLKILRQNFFLIFKTNFNCVFSYITIVILNMMKKHLNYEIPKNKYMNKIQCKYKDTNFAVRIE